MPLGRLELAIRDQVDRYTLTIDVIDRVPALQTAGVHLKERMKDAIIESVRYAHKNGIDKPDIRNWT